MQPHLVDDVAILPQAGREVALVVPGHHDGGRHLHVGAHLRNMGRRWLWCSVVVVVVAVGQAMRLRERQLKKCEGNSACDHQLKEAPGARQELRVVPVRGVACVLLPGSTSQYAFETWRGIHGIAGVLPRRRDDEGSPDGPYLITEGLLQHLGGW